MALPVNKRGFRPITVDGVRYRWRCDNNRTADLEVHLETKSSDRGQRLCVNWSSKITSPITGRAIAIAIRTAILKGWQPVENTGDYCVDLDFPISD